MKKETFDEGESQDSSIVIEKTVEKTVVENVQNEEKKIITVNPKQIEIEGNLIFIKSVAYTLSFVKDVEMNDSTVEFTLLDNHYCVAFDHIETATKLFNRLKEAEQKKN